jgi:hypothetical protein
VPNRRGAGARDRRDTAPVDGVTRADTASGTFSDMPAAPITRCITVKWDRPRYELLDRRGAVIAALAEVSEISGFAPTLDVLAVRFVGGTSILMNLQRMYVTVPSPNPPDVYRRHVEAVASALGAPRGGLEVSLQHLLPWPPENDPVQAQIYSASTSTGVPSATDFAGLIDGVQDEAWTYKAEFGVVAANEVPVRLKRAVGRAAGPKFETTFEDIATAPVSTFVDAQWMFHRLADVTTTECWEAVSQVDEYSAALADELHTHLSSRREGDLGDSA